MLKLIFYPSLYFCFLTAGLFAQSGQETGDESVLWTPPRAIPLNTEKRSEIFDGMPSSWLSLSAPQLSFRWIPGNDWLLGPGEGESSLTFVKRLDPSLQMQLFLFPEEGSLNDLEAESLKRYASSLPGQYPGMELMVESLRFSRPGIGRPLLLDGSYRKVDYQLGLKADDGPSVHVIDLLTLVEGEHLFVLRFQGSERFIAAIESKLDAEITRFHLEE